MEQNITVKEVVNLAAGDAVIFKIPQDYINKTSMKMFRQVKEELDEVGIKAIFINDEIEIDIFRSEESNGKS